MTETLRPITSPTSVFKNMIESSNATMYMLEAEKAFGTIHFAIGDSYGIGKSKSKFHFDGLVEKVTLAAGRRTRIKNGVYLVQ